MKSPIAKPDHFKFIYLPIRPNTGVRRFLKENPENGKPSEKPNNQWRTNSIIGGEGAHIHIFEFTDHENNRFQTKLIVQNMNI